MFDRSNRRAVTKSDEFGRVLALPRRAPVDLDGPRGEALVELMTERLAKPKGFCICNEMRPPRRCVTRLKPAQAWALFEAPLAGGLLGAIGVGHGKTGLDILMATVFHDQGYRIKNVVLLVPPGLLGQLEDDYKAWREHFRVPSFIFPNGTALLQHDKDGRPMPTVHVVPFSKLSRPEATEMLEDLAPDLIIIDEAHRARHPDTATTRRILRYFAQHPECLLCCWSGTLTAKSLLDFWHLSAFALDEGSPLPVLKPIVEEWASAIDPSDYPAPIGALRFFCNPGEHVYSGFHRRLVDTRGVVATKSQAVDASIVISERKAPPIPKNVKEALTLLRAKWERPDGEQFVEALELAACARQLACGFFYRWRFPRGEAPELIERWRTARRNWNSEVRERLHHPRQHLDSPKLCENAAARAWASEKRLVEGSVTYEGDLPRWKAIAWPEWSQIRDAVEPETEAVWLSDYLAEDASEWGLKNRGIIWYQHSAFGERVAKMSGLNLHGGGLGAGARIRAEDGARSIVASIKAHGTGTDGLQRLFYQQLVASPPPSSGDTWEQLLGRLHRIGFEGDEVITLCYRHTPELAEAIDKALIQAKYIEGVLGTYQKLLAADYDFHLT